MDHPSDVVDDENAQLSLDPKVQAYLAQVSRESGCWGRCFPIPFERAAEKSWWDPTFDSEILEEQYKKSANPLNTTKFRYALWYVFTLSIMWFIYFLSTGLATGNHHWPVLCVVLLILSALVAIALLLTRTNFYTSNFLKIYLIVSLFLCILSLSFVILIPLRFEPYVNRPSHLSPVGHFSICIEILLLIYTLIPLRLYMCITIGALYSVTFELITYFTHDNSYDALTVIVRLLSHVCIHLIGLHILIMTNVRMRNTFMKVGQSLLVRKQLEAEKKLKENMIHSLMPPSVAQWLLSDDENFIKKNGNRTYTSDSNDISCIFRPFNMNHMSDVSILFADIVGFTRMSSNKSAEDVVEILNNLFQRFDDLCKLHNCEKISTLGDCYYCVSGCPEPRDDHAECCVEMGLSMIQAIRLFEQEQNEGVNMRVGVHTGTVLCGIVGTRRFKFDVWSNDVTLANRMESSGKPGMVHISEITLKFLKGTYLYEEGDSVDGVKTYFILGRKPERPTSHNGSFRGTVRALYTPLQVMISPPTSPPSVSPQGRPRVLSCDTTHMKPMHNPNQLSPDICKFKASSLPSILDSEAEQDMENDKISCGENESAKTPTSTASSGRYSMKKSWKIPKFLRKTDQKVDGEGNGESVAMCEETSVNPSGYQQVPTIIETQNITLLEPPPNGGTLGNSWTNVSQCGDEKQNGFYLDDQKDVIDVKSYISQSRSDISPYDFSPNEFSNFLRTGSYRSQYGRSPNELSFLARAGSNRSRRGRSPNLDIYPTERARSATVHSVATDRHKTALEVPRLSGVIVPDDHVSTAYSLNSRKDSGIKSNSRRSSIQIENPLPSIDPAQHRVSGYYTSSQSTINSIHQCPVRLPPFFDKHGICIQNLRKQSDRQLIKCVQDNSASKQSYFMKPTLSRITLFFNDRKMEAEYRANVHSIDKQAEAIPTLANSRFNLYIDVFVSALVFTIVSLGLFLLYTPSTTWLIAFGLSILMQMIGVALCSYSFSQFCERVFVCCQRWYRWNAFGALLVSLPLIAVLTNFSCSRVFSTSRMSDYLYSYLLFVGVIHFCNFTQLNCWMKNILATIFVIVFTYLLFGGVCPDGDYTTLLIQNETHQLVINASEFVENFPNSTFYENGTATNSELPDNFRLQINYLYDSEIFMDLLLLLILVWFLNREFEIGYRLSFHANFMATRDRSDVQKLKNQADWLIYNIVPEHVAEHLKKDAKYSENFNNVAIIFASIVNFNEMYDESYLGGKEYLRVLNELIGDFDELLTLKEYQSIEKIKTIGSTFMAASGLNSELRKEQQDPNEHLYALMDFAISMQHVIDNFNRDLLEFNLVLRIGYNFGDVTAAVIGRTKLYYDIWGDAVNIASRMDSTGVNGRIQVGENCLSVLEKRYEFEPRGSVYVKGKDNMNVYLLLRKKETGEEEDA